MNGRPLKWTGRTAAVLQESLYMSNYRFAERIGVAVRTVAAWHEKPRSSPNYEIQEALDTLLATSDDRTKERFATLFPLATTPGIGQGPAEDAERVVPQWSGELGQLLMHAFRMTQEAFAEHLGVSVRTVGKWAAEPDCVPRADMQQILDTAYMQAPEPVRARFAHLLPSPDAPPVQPQAVAPAPAAVDPVVAQMAAEMALMQARIDSMQEQMGALALRLLAS
ncbi:hypothetical protein [Streptomyces niveus]|uniref:hypothetical protein n=1 Tax=Streptomyces niveus TaxID=193462 RepID=UPI0020D2681F|nr:hypothetical protein [Streptomyces niveus]